MEMQSVASSNIEAVGYNSATQKLRVRFKGGKIYEYDDVLPETVGDFMESESPGGFFARVIRNGGYSFAQVEEDEDDADETEQDEDEEGETDGDG